MKTRLNHIRKSLGGEGLWKLRASGALALPHWPVQAPQVPGIPTTLGRNPRGEQLLLPGLLLWC